MLIQILGEESLAGIPRRLVLTDVRCLRPPHGVPIKELRVPLQMTHMKRKSEEERGKEKDRER